MSAVCMLVAFVAEKQFYLCDIRYGGSVAYMYIAIVVYPASLHQLRRLHGKPHHIRHRLFVNNISLLPQQSACLMSTTSRDT